ncbi:MAG: T9SS type A sorting domain-containing protein [bacterium]
MKKSTLLFIAFFAFVAVRSQNVPREMVAFEDFTGTWCQWCPGCQMGSEDLLLNGKFVAVIANHFSDGYANAYSNARNSMYNVQAYPSVSFDGTKCYNSGALNSSLYTKYLPYYNQAIAVTSPVKMSMVVVNDGLSYTAVVTLTKVGEITSVTNVLYFFVTQSNIDQNWQTQTTLEHVNRLMAPNQNGTVIDFSGGDVQTVTLNFNMNANWPLEDCEFVALLQNKDAGQGNQGGLAGGYPLKKFVVYQTIKKGVIDLTLEFSASDTAVTTLDSVFFTNETSGGYIGTPETYEWLFPGANPSTSVEKDPTVIYPVAGEYDVTLIVNRGGQIDTVTKTAYIKSSWPTGVLENKNPFNARVFPNPNNGIFIVSMNTTKATITEITITNTAGAVFYKESGVNINGQMQKTIQLDNVASGIYYLTIQSDDSKSVQKIVVK